MTKAELVEKIFVKSGLETKTGAEKALNATLAVLSEALTAGSDVTLTGFGAFKVIDRAPRKGRNPRTGMEITIPAYKTVKFIPGKNLKESVK